MARNNWSRQELIVAYNLYCKTPFTKINSINPGIKELAKIIDRSPSAVALKLANFARLDPALQARNISGMSHGSKGEEAIWLEFNNNWEDLVFESEIILAEISRSTIETAAGINIADLPKEGKERNQVVKTRVNQNFFRKAVLASYDNSCCITGISEPEILVAGHIIPWSKDRKNRMNPQNGICLNALHDKAFDLGLITITPEFKVKISNQLYKRIKKTTSEVFFLPFIDKKIKLPQKFIPLLECLDYHNSNIFRG